MKTTVDIDDELLVAAKRRAAEQRRTLRSLVEEGLRNVISRRRAPRPARTVRWVVVDGGLPPVDIANREAMSEWIRAERDSS